MSTLRLGALEPRHRGRLAEILAATRAFNGDEIGVALELFDDAFAGREPGSDGGDSGQAPPSAYEFVGAFDESDALVGYACYGPTPGADAAFDLYWIAVHPAAQGAGQGSRLLAEVERRLRERSARLLVVETSSRDAYEATRRFYGARGYGDAARVADFYAPGDDRVIYTKRLTPKSTSADRPPSIN
jgi:ribosomal protein S18 acetylase RimI-like enzyme